MMIHVMSALKKKDCLRSEIIESESYKIGQLARDKIR